MYKKAFRLEGYVVCFVSAYTAWFPVVICRVVVTDSSPVDERLGTSQFYIIISLSTTKSDTFSIAHHNKGWGLEKADISFQTIAIR